MIRSGRGPIRHGCFGGGCGICRMKIVKGEYEKVKRMSRAHVSEAEEGEGIALICCVRPLGDLVIAGAKQAGDKFVFDFIKAIK